MKWYRKLHWQIIIGMILGLIYGIAAAQFQWTGFATNWVVPFGDIFMNLLKLIAVPLVLTSLVAGVASLSDFKKLSRMGSKTIGLYIATTAVAVTIGLLVVNTLQPGAKLPDATKAKLEAQFQANAADKAEGETAETVRQRGPLQPLVDMVPDNFFGSASSNRNMLQLVFVSLLIGIALVQVNSEHRQPVLSIFEGLQAVVIKLVNMIMLMAPIGVFALITKTITSLAVGEGGQTNLGEISSILGALGYYCIAVFIGLLLHIAVVYLGLLKLLTPLKLSQFFKAIAPAQLLAFSTSSSGATLPVTMRQCKEKLGTSKETTSFVLPLGATINMDGTALYQAVAAVFIAQASGMTLDMGAQLTIVITAVLASIGTAAVPGAGIIMLVIILEAIDVPSEGIALILGVDRILDMLRTTTNVTGDAAVCAVIAHSEKQLHPIVEENENVESNDQPQAAPAPDRDQFVGKKTTAGICGILLGTLGIHRFILGDKKGGIIRIVISLVTCGFGGIIGFIEGILYLMKSDDDFYQQYGADKKGWF